MLYFLRLPSNSQPKKQTHCLQWVLLGEDLVISPIFELRVYRCYCRKDQLREDLEWSWNTSSKCLILIIVPWSKASCISAKGVPRARFACAVGKVGLLWETSPLGPVDAVTFHWQRHWVANGKHTHIHVSISCHSLVVFFPAKIWKGLSLFTLYY